MAASTVSSLTSLSSMSRARVYSLREFGEYADEYDAEEEEERDYDNDQLLGPRRSIPHDLSELRQSQNFSESSSSISITTASSRPVTVLTHVSSGTSVFDYLPMETEEDGSFPEQASTTSSNKENSSHFPKDEDEKAAVTLAHQFKVPETMAPQTASANKIHSNDNNGILQRPPISNNTTQRHLVDVVLNCDGCHGIATTNLHATKRGRKQQVAVDAKSKPQDSALKSFTASMFRFHGAGAVTADLSVDSYLQAPTDASSSRSDDDDDDDENDQEDDDDEDEDDDDDISSCTNQSSAANGQDGENLLVAIKTLRISSEKTDKDDVTHAISIECERSKSYERKCRTQVMLGRTVALNELRTISLSSRGGNAAAGGHGGNGGVIQVRVSKQDSYLLMALEDCCLYNENPSRSSLPIWPMLSRIQGGKGGNGSGSMTDGMDGKFEILLEDKVSHPWKVYPSRYDLRLESFVYEASKYGGGGVGSGGGVFQFGEVAYITYISVRNIGPMPSPAAQRVAIELAGDCHPSKKKRRKRTKFTYIEARPDRGRAFLQQSIAGSGSVERAVGRIAFGVRMPPLSQLMGPGRDDYDPIVRDEIITLQAVQLGPERRDPETGILSGHSEYRRSYKNFHQHSNRRQYPSQDEKKSPNKLSVPSLRREFQQDDGDDMMATVRLAFPVENVSGLIGLKSLCSTGDTTVVKLLLANVGGFDLGSATSRAGGRIVGVRFYIRHDDDEGDCSSRGKYTIRPDQVHVIDDHPLGAGRSFSNRTHRRWIDAHQYLVQSNGEDYSNHVDIRTPPHSIIVDVPYLKVGASVVVQQNLQLTSSVQPYQRTALQADILLQDIASLEQEQYTSPSMAMNSGKSTDGSLPRLFRGPPAKVVSVVQRRKLEILCEPRFVPLGGHGKVILVTSAATTREQYTAWMDHVFSDRFGWADEAEVSCYSVSRYGHLNPKRKVDGYGDDRRTAVTLKELFADKLVIVLDDEFTPVQGSDTKTRPSQLIPSGCPMSQSSGFDPSTRWLIVRGGDNENGVPTATPLTNTNDQTSNVGAAAGAPTPVQEMLTALLTVDVDPTFEDCGVSQYKQWLEQIVRKERYSGSYQRNPVRCDTVCVKCQSRLRPSAPYVTERLKSMRSTLAVWLSKTDPMRQYILEYEALPTGPERLLGRRSPYPAWRIGTLFIRRGECFAHNCAVTVKATSFKAGASSLSSPHSSPRDSRTATTQATSPSQRLSDLSIQSSREITTPQVLMGVALGLSVDDRTELFFQSLGRKLEEDPANQHLDDTLEVLKDAVASQFLWEITNLRDGRMALNPWDHVDGKAGTVGIVHHFPTIGALLGCVDFSSRFRGPDAATTRQRLDAATPHCSDLMARLECIADLMDITSSNSTSPNRKGPVSSMAPKSRIDGDSTLALSGMVQTLRKRWKVVVHDVILDRKKEEIMVQVKRAINVPVSGISGLRQFTAMGGRKRRWRDGLMHVFSSRNADKYPLDGEENLSGPMVLTTVDVNRYVDFGGPGGSDDEVVSALSETGDVATETSRDTDDDDDVAKASSANLEKTSFGRVICLSVKEADSIRRADKRRRDYVDIVRNSILSTRQEFLRLDGGSCGGDDNTTDASSAMFSI